MIENLKVHRIIGHEGDKEMEKEIIALLIKQDFFGLEKIY